MIIVKDWGTGKGVGASLFQPLRLLSPGGKNEKESFPKSQVVLAAVYHAFRELYAYDSQTKPDLGSQRQSDRVQPCPPDQSPGPPKRPTGAFRRQPRIHRKLVSKATRRGRQLDFLALLHLAGAGNGVCRGAWGYGQPDRGCHALHPAS